MLRALLIHDDVNDRNQKYKSHKIYIKILN